MRSGRNRALAAMLWAASAAFPLGAQSGQVSGGAQAALGRALELETSGKLREALGAYREAMSDPDLLVGAVLGMERAWSQLGHPDSLLPLLDSVLAVRPQQPTLRAAQLRTLFTLGRDEAVQRAFDQWVALSPRDAVPYREYARLLLDVGRTRSADTVLQEAARRLESTRELGAELAQLRVALGMWEGAAETWREALEASPFLEQAATFSLMAAPPAMRDSVRGALLAPPIELLPRKVMAILELRWQSARDGWRALSELPPGDSTVRVWLDFADEADAAEAWLVARDAWAAALQHGAHRSLAVRAAAAALQGGDPASALDLVVKSSLGDSASAGTAVLIHVRALGLLGRPQEAEQILNTRGAALDREAKAQAHRALAWGWVRVGDLTRARAALAHAPGDEEDRATAWIALYEGDLKTARKGLRHADEATSEAVLAMALLSRTRAERSPSIGEGFLLLARGDSGAAAKRFEIAAQDSGVSDATPLLLQIAGRLTAAAGDTAHAIALWQRIVEHHAAAPEAAEAELEWARVLRRRGDFAAAVARLEHLILTWPQSALVPQARRELAMARAGK